MIIHQEEDLQGDKNKGIGEEDKRSKKNNNNKKCKFKEIWN